MKKFIMLLVTLAIMATAAFSYAYVGIERQHIQITSTLGVELTTGTTLPTSTQLIQNYPNPFNPTTTVPFELKAPTHMSMLVYDITGRQVATLVNGNLEAGAHTARFNASNLASGIYLCRLQAGDAIKTIKMALTK